MYFDPVYSSLKLTQLRLYVYFVALVNMYMGEHSHPLQIKPMHLLAFESTNVDQQ